jgi:hypothetical protein
VPAITARWLAEVPTLELSYVALPGLADHTKRGRGV